MFFTLKAHAILEFEDATSPELLTSARALAMGNAYMSKVDDAWSAFYNPAGLGTVRGIQFHLANLHLETNNDFLDVTGGSGNFTDSISNYSSALTPTGLRTLLAENPGNTTHARVQAFPNITFRGLTLGYMYSKQNRARLLSPTSDFEIAERIDQGPVFALNLSLFGGIVKIGASAIHLTREQLQKDFASGDPIDVNKANDYVGGAMTHMTAGLRVTLPFYLLPTFSAVVRNSSNQDWHTPQFSGTPERIPQTVDASFSITPFTGRTSRMHIEVGVKDLGDRYEDVPSARKTMAGFEFDYMRTFFVRGGYGDGWGSAGIGVRNRSFIFDLTSYAQEGSISGVREKEDRRFVLSISQGL